ncbi:hypothetical protein BKI52_19385 [marine bacterium AO1-C]|nr:hypothetical protein BKI52_19385 [marine bacterium AO1-C]
MNSKQNLTTIIPLNRVPAPLNAVTGGLANLLEGILYRNLQKDVQGSSATYVLDIEFANPLQWKLFGIDDFVLSVNSSPAAPTLNVRFSYDWKILDYFSDIDIYNFGNTVEEIFEILLDLAGITRQELFTEVLHIFIGGSVPVQTFVNAINSNTSYPTSSPLTNPNSGNFGNDVLNILTQLYNNDLNIIQIIIDEYIMGGGPTFQDRVNTLMTLFSTWLDNITLDKVLELITPKFSLTVTNPTVSLSFPTNIFRRVNDQTLEPLDNDGADVPAELTADLGTLGFSTEQGFIYGDAVSFSFTKAEIARTGIILEIVDLQVDLADHQNQLPGTGNYPANFKGVYTNEVIITLPTFWSKNSSGAIDIIGQDILFGSYEDAQTTKHTIFSGTLILAANTSSPQVLTTTLPGNLTLGLESFLIKFEENEVTKSIIKGVLTLPVGDGSNTHTIQLEGAYQTNGFSITASGSNGNSLFGFDIADVVRIDFDNMSVGSIDGRFFFAMGARVTFDDLFPVLKKFIPNPIELTRLKVSEQGIEEFEINFNWSDLKEKALESASGSSVISIPLNLDIADIIKIFTLKLRIDYDIPNKAVAVDALLDGQLALGPLIAQVGDIGVSVSWVYDADNGGNLGPLQMDMEFVPPTKIGLSIDAEAVKGAGAIWLDYDKERYAGGLEIRIVDQINLAAVGIMAFKKPDGSKGFSLLLLVSADGFAKIQLGMGFILTGVGGLLALNRSMDTEVLRSGIRTGATDQILFPSNILENFDALINNLDSAFPIQEGQFVFGPMFQMGWGGVNSFIQVEVGLFIELFNPVRIAIPGVAKTLLPDDNSKVIQINLAFIAIVDFQAKYFSLDASLYASKILDTITLQGDVAFRLKWGSQPNFVFTIGGFHPEFTPPPLNLPALRRLSISLIDTKNAKVALEAYFAITANSVQLGARLDARFSAGKFAVVGYLGFDALFEFNPFRFVISVGAGFSVTFNEFPILAISLDFRLAGPTPWHVQGQATFAIIGIEFKVNFDETFGERRETTLPGVSVRPLLIEALEKDDNWQTAFPIGNNDLVRLQSVPGQLLVHPSGTLQVVQKVLPLDTQLEKFGEQAIDGDNSFRLTGIYLDGQLLETEVVEEYFSPGQFKQLTEAEKVTRPSFEPMPAGVKIKPTQALFTSPKQDKLVAYEEILLAPPVASSGNNLIIMSAPQANVVGNANTIGVNPAQVNVGLTPAQAIQRVERQAPENPLFFYNAQNHNASAQSGLAPQEGIDNNLQALPKGEQYYIVSSIDLQPFTDATHLPNATALSQQQAQEKLERILESDPALDGLLLVLPAYELEIFNVGGGSTTTPINTTISVNRNDLITT